MNIKTLRVFQFLLIALMSMPYCANTYAAVYQSPTDDVSFKSFNVSMVDGKWKATGVIQRDPRNLVTIWASLDGGAMKKIGNQIEEDGSFYFTPSKYWSIDNNKAHYINVQARYDNVNLDNCYAYFSFYPINDINLSALQSKSLKVTGVVKKDPRNLVTIWASLDGGTMKKIGNQIKADGSFYFTPYKHWDISDGLHTIKVEARSGSNWTDDKLFNNTASVYHFEYTPSAIPTMDDVYIKNFDVSEVGDKQIATGVVQSDPCNSITLWTTAAGLGMKKVESQIGEDGSFSFVLSDYFDLSSFGNSLYGRSVIAVPTWGDPDFSNNYANDPHLFSYNHRRS